jgi:hypothetical protein
LVTQGSSSTIGCNEMAENGVNTNYWKDTGLPIPLGNFGFPSNAGDIGDCNVSDPPVVTLSSVTASPSSCTQGTSACNDVDLSASLTTNYNGGSKRWRYNCGGSAANTMNTGTQASPPCSRTTTKSAPRNDHCVGGYQDNKADLWYDYPDCDGLSSCTFTDVCDMVSETAGTYKMKVYAESGPGAGIRPSGHAEITFTVN